MTKVYLVRHCESLSNEMKVAAGHTDFDISERGKLQLKYLAERFRDMELDVIYTSPLQRAYKTALAINQYPQVEVVKDECFIEKFIGELEGKPLTGLSVEEQEVRRLQPHLFCPKGGETPIAAGERGFAALLDLVEKNRGKSIAIAAHGGLLQGMFCLLKKLPWERMLEVKDLDNTCVNLVQFYDDGTWEIVYENDTSNLPADAAAVSMFPWASK